MITILELATSDRALVRKIKDRAGADIEQVRDQVIRIIDAVRREGDQALVKYTREFDNPSFTEDRLVVTEADIDAAYRAVTPEVLERIREQISLSKVFHEAQRRHIVDWEETTEEGIAVGERWTPMDAVGLYVPGGKNPFPTVQQILAVPAKIAGCERIVSVVSPRGRIDEVLVAARECGVEEIYCVAGPHAVAALAYGTERIKPVDLVAGPGNPYVTAAKVLCQERIAIDMPAGPSEAIMLVDEPAGSDKEAAARLIRYCAADVLARAEHGPDSAGVLVTHSKQLADAVAAEIDKQAKLLTRQDYIYEALGRYSAIVVTRSLDESIEFTNEYAPEHLEVLSSAPRKIFSRIRHAGSVFLGMENPVAVGDYATGVNHILPTGGWARRSSAVGVWTFMKRVQYSELSPRAIRRLQPIVSTIADVEGLDAHRRSVEMRCE